MKKTLALALGMVLVAWLGTAYRTAPTSWLAQPSDSLQLGPRPAGLPDPETSYYDKKHQSWQSRLLYVAATNKHVTGRRQFQLENYLVHQSEYVAKPLTAIFQADASVAAFYTWLRPAVLFQWQRMSHHKRAQLYDGLRYVRRYLDVFDLAREEALYASDKDNYGRPLTTPSYAKGLEVGLHWGNTIDYGWLRAFVYRRVKSGVSVSLMRKWSERLLQDLAPTENGTLDQQRDSNTTEIASYKKGKRHGQWVYRHKKASDDGDEELVSLDSCYYENDLPQGVWRRSFGTDRSRFWVAQFEKGRLVGGGEIDIPWGQAGTLQVSETKGQLVYSETDAKGLVLARGHMPLLADTLHHIAYHPKTGHRRLETTLHVRYNNAPIGHYRSWHANGKLESEGYYALAPDNYAHEVGLWQHYYDNGQRNHTHFYDTQGYLRDSSLYYDAKGRVRQRIYYSRAVKFYQQPNRLLSYDSTGALVSDEMRVGTQLAGSARYYASGRLRSEGKMKNGGRDSLWRSYHANGRLQASTFYKKGMKDGAEQVYDEKGQLMATLSYEQARRVGQYKDYHPNGQLHTEGQYASVSFEEDDFNNDVGGRDNVQTQPPPPAELPAIEVWPCGPAIYRAPPLGVEGGYVASPSYEVQRLWQEYTHQGTMQGLWRSYHPNGNIKLETSFGADAGMNVTRCYDQQGTLLLDIQMLGGAYEGSHHRNYANGKPALRAHFKSGVLDGPYEYYSPAGVLLQKGNCSNGNRTGVWQYRYPNGKPQMTVVYDSTGIVSVTNALTPEGKALASAVAKGNGNYIELTPAGQVLAQGRLLRGQPIGPWRHPIGSHYVTIEVVLKPENRYVNLLSEFGVDFLFNDEQAACFDSLSRMAPGAGYLWHTPQRVAGSPHDFLHTDDAFNGTAPEVEDSNAQLFAKSFPNHAGYHYVIANAYFYLQQHEQASKHYQRTLALNKHYITTHLYLAAIALRMGSKAVAEQRLQQFELLVAQNQYVGIPRWAAGTSFAAAQCHGELNNKAKALYWLERAIRQDKLHPDQIHNAEMAFVHWADDPEMKRLIELATNLNYKHSPEDE